MSTQITFPTTAAILFANYLSVDQPSYGLKLELANVIVKLVNYAYFDGLHDTGGYPIDPTAKIMSGIRDGLLPDPPSETDVAVLNLIYRWCNTAYAQGLARRTNSAITNTQEELPWRL